MDRSPIINNLRKHCEFLADPKLNGRVSGTQGNRIAREYIRKQFENSGLMPLFGESWYQKYHTRVTGEKITAVNIGGRLPSKKQTNKVHILIGAHYDHLEGIPGADDNASSIAIIIEAARIMVEESKDRRLKNLIFVAFDAEERPFYLTPDMGSVYFFENRPVNNIDGAVLLDLCGHDFPMPGKEDVVFIIGTDSSATFAEYVPTIKGNSITPVIANDRYVGAKSDYYVFKESGIPYIFISVGWWSSYHKPTDTLEKLNYSKMQGICHYLVELIQIILKNDLVKEPYDITDLEARCLSKLIGQEIPADRSTIDKIVERFKFTYMSRST